MKILLDYLFPVTLIEPTPAASTAFLKQVLVVGLPDSGVTAGVITACTTNTAIAAKFGTQATAEAQKLLDAGMSKVYVLPVAGLDDVAAAIAGHETDFFTILITSDFSDTNVTTDLDVGNFEGVVGVSSTDDTFLATQAAIANRCAFHTTSTNKAKNMMFAFGSMLSNSLNWRNQQYISMPVADDVETLGDANSLFDSRISFVISDDEFSNRLAFFVAGGKAITAPYIIRNLQVDMQSKALNYISGNQPGYTKTHASLLEDELQKVIDSYINAPRQWLEAGTVAVDLVEDNFVASGSINVSEPKALWRVFAEMRQTL
jgi:hypothetical protein